MRTTTLRTTLISAALGTALLTLAVPAAAQTGDRDCDDFPDQASAQAFFAQDTSDPSDLDRNNNFVACEDYDGYPAGSARNTSPARPTVSTVPQTSTAQTATVRPTRIDTGGGGTAELSATTTLATATLAAIGMAAGIGLVISRRARAR